LSLLVNDQFDICHLIDPLFTNYLDRQASRGNRHRSREAAMKLLHLDSSALGTHSVTRELSAAVVRKRHEGVRGEVVTMRGPYEKGRNAPRKRGDHPGNSGCPSWTGSAVACGGKIAAWCHDLQADRTC